MHPNKPSNVGRKKGRPPAPWETEQVAIRLPRPMVEQFRKQRGLSREIRERLGHSLAQDEIEPNFRKLMGQIEQLAKSVNRHFGAEWHADVNAHRAFIDTLRRLLADIPEPTASTTNVGVSAKVAAEFIYRDYVATVRELEAKGHTDFRSTTRQQGENDR